MPQLDKFTYFTQLFRSCLDVKTFSWILLSVLFVCSIVQCYMEGTDSSRRRKRLESASSSSLAGFGGSDDENDPNKRRKLPVTKECDDATINRIRSIIQKMVRETENQTLLHNINNPTNRAWNPAIQAALDERFGHSRWNLLTPLRLMIVTGELTIQGDQSRFFLRVLSLVKGD